MIRSLVEADIPLVVELTRKTGVFLPHEIVALEEVLADYFATNHTVGHRAITEERPEGLVGYAYYAPAAMTDRTWYLYWIAVEPDLQGQGIGAQLLEFVEQNIQRLGGRILFIETSSLPRYVGTRSFYQKVGYEVTGQLRDFYTDGDDMVVFRKRIQPNPG